MNYIISSYFLKSRESKSDRGLGHKQVATYPGQLSG